MDSGVARPSFMGAEANTGANVEGVRPCRGSGGMQDMLCFTCVTTCACIFMKSKVYLWGVLVNAIEYWQILFEKALR